MKNIIIYLSIIAISVGLTFGILAYQKAQEPEIGTGENVYGASITTIAATDKISDSRTTINNNFSALNNALQWTGYADYIAPSSTKGIIIDASSTISALWVYGNATTTNATTTGSLAISSITGSTQCLQIDTNGLVSGSGSGCGGTGISNLNSETLGSIGDVSTTTLSYGSHLVWDTSNWVSTSTWPFFQTEFNSFYNATTTFGGNAATATALAANGANCTNQFPLGVDTLGAVESCTTITSAYMDMTAAYIWSGIGTYSGDLRTTGILHATTTDFDLLVVNGHATTTGSLYIGADLKVNTSVDFPANSITDAMVSNTLTASDLVAGSEVVSDAEVVDTLTASNYVRTSTWTDINNYPTACTNQAVTGLGDTLTCNTITSAYMDMTTAYSWSGINTFSSDLRAGNLLHASTTDFDKLQVNGNGTTTGQFFVEGERIIGWKGSAFSVSSSTLLTEGAYGASGTTTIELPPTLWAERWGTLRAYTDTGTSTARVGDCTNYMEFIEAGGDADNISSISLTTNNTFTAGESVCIQIGHQEGTPNRINFSWTKEVLAD